MQSERQQIFLVLLIFTAIIAACLTLVWVGYSFFTSQIDTELFPTATNTPPKSEGVAITSVTAGTAGAAAGLQPGHIILEANDVVISSVETLQAVVANTPAGGDITLILLVNGEKRQTTAVRPQSPPYLGITVVERDTFVFEPTFAPPATEIPPTPNVPPTLAIVAEVTADSPAQAAGLMPGDVITAVDGQVILTREELVNRLLQSSSGENVTLVIRRGEDTLIRSVTLAPHPDDSQRGFLGIVLR